MPWPNFYGLGREGCIDSVWHHSQTQEISNGYINKLTIIYTELIINESLSKCNENLVHYLPCQVSDVLHMLISALAVCLKALAFALSLIALASNNNNNNKGFV